MVDYRDEENAFYAPTTPTGEPDPEWNALIERGRHGGDDGAEAVVWAYQKGIRTGIARVQPIEKPYMLPPLPNVLDSAVEAVGNEKSTLDVTIGADGPGTLALAWQTHGELPTPQQVAAMVGVLLAATGIEPARSSRQPVPTAREIESRLGTLLRAFGKATNVEPTPRPQEDTVGTERQYAETDEQYAERQQAEAAQPASDSQENAAPAEDDKPEGNGNTDKDNPRSTGTI